jgi:hypothetical protein
VIINATLSDLAPVRIGLFVASGTLSSQVSTAGSAIETTIPDQVLIGNDFLWDGFFHCIFNLQLLLNALFSIETYHPVDSEFIREHTIIVSPENHLQQHILESSHI